MSCTAAWWGSNGNALHWAAARGHVELVKVLLEAGMKPTIGEDRTGPRSGKRPQRTRQRRGRATAGTQRWSSCWFGHRRTEGPPLLQLPKGRTNSRVKTGHLKKFIFRGENSFGFISPDANDEDVFVHLDTIRKAASTGSRSGFPAPGHGSFTSRSRAARARGRLKLPMRRMEVVPSRGYSQHEQMWAEDAWEEHDEYSDSSDEYY